MTKLHRYMEISARLSREIQSGILPAGEKAPSLREITKQYAVSLGTALQAYEHLEKLGLLRSEPKRGFFVNPISAPRRPEKTASTVLGPSDVHALPMVDQVLQPANESAYCSFATAELAVSWQPVQALEKALRAVAKENMAGLGQYIPSPGYAPLRQQLALRSFEWGGNLHADEILITNGATDALYLSLRATTRPGDIVATESPTYFGLLQLLRQLQLQVIEIPTDSQTGIDIAAFEQALQRFPVKAVVLSSNFQNPFGCSMPVAHQTALLALAETHELVVIEDDVYGDLFFGEHRPAPLLAQDRQDRVIHCNSFSKTAVPGYRLGWCATQRWLPKIRQLQVEQNIAVSSLPQLVMHHFLASGDYSRHLHYLREKLRGQLPMVTDTLLAHLPRGTRVSQPDGGFVLWLELPGHISALDVYVEAKAKGVLVTPGDLFFAQSPKRNCLRLSVGAPFGPEMRLAIATLGDICQQLQYAGAS